MKLFAKIVPKGTSPLIISTLFFFTCIFTVYEISRVFPKNFQFSGEDDGIVMTVLFAFLGIVISMIIAGLIREYVILDDNHKVTRLDVAINFVIALIGSYVGIIIANSLPSVTIEGPAVRLFLALIILIIRIIFEEFLKFNARINDGPE